MAPLTSLLRKRGLVTREELCLPWRPLYTQYERLFHSNLESVGLLRVPGGADTNMRGLVRLARPYFPLSATQEMLVEWRPLLCPLDVTMGKAFSYLELFLPTHCCWLAPQLTYQLWYAELLSFWSACGNSPMWEPALLGLLAR